MHPQVNATTRSTSSAVLAPDLAANVHIYLGEIGDIQDHIEHGPHWDTVEIVEIRRTITLRAPT